MTHAALKGDFERAGRIHTKLFPLFQRPFCETNPIPLKAAMAMMGLCEEIYRLPLVPMSDANRAQLKTTLLASLGEGVSPVKVIICGARGRMGRSLIACAQGDPELEIVAEIDQGDDLAKVISRQMPLSIFQCVKRLLRSPSWPLTTRKRSLSALRAMAMRKRRSYAVQQR